MKTKPARPITAHTSKGPSELRSQAEINAVDGSHVSPVIATPWRLPTRRWFLGAVAVAAAAVVVVKPKPVEALPTRWIGHC